MEREGTGLTQQEGKGRARKRKLLIALGVAAILPPLLIRLEAERLKRREDPEKGELLSETLGEKGCYLESFDGCRLYAEELGEGPLMVLSHGWFCNTDMWHYQKKHLSEKFRMVCYDQRGHSRSELNDATGVSLEVLARDLKCVVDNYRRDEPCMLVGHSMGGMAMLKFAQMFPEELGSSVRSVVLVDTSNLPLGSCMAGGAALDRIRKPLVEPAIRWIARHGGFSDRVKGMVVGRAPFLVATRYLGYGRGASLTQMEYIGEMARKTSMTGAGLAALGLLEHSEEVSLEALGASGLPVLIWVGENDKLTRPEVSRGMHSRLPASSLYVVPRTGHPSYMEEYELFNRVLEELARQVFSGG